MASKSNSTPRARRNSRAKAQACVQGKHETSRVEDLSVAEQLEHYERLFPELVMKILKVQIKLAEFAIERGQLGGRKPGLDQALEIFGGSTAPFAVLLEATAAGNARAAATLAWDCCHRMCTWDLDEIERIVDERIRAAKGGSARLGGEDAEKARRDMAVRVARAEWHRAPDHQGNAAWAARRVAESADWIALLKVQGIRNPITHGTIARYIRESRAKPKR